MLRVRMIVPLVAPGADAVREVEEVRVVKAPVFGVVDPMVPK